MRSHRAAMRVVQARTWFSLPDQGSLESALIDRERRGVVRRKSRLGPPYGVVPGRAVLSPISALSSSCLAGRSQHGTHGGAGPAHVLAERVREAFSFARPQ